MLVVEVQPALVKVVTPFGLMMSTAMDLRPDYCPVLLIQLEGTIVAIMKMLGLHALQVSLIINKPLSPILYYYDIDSLH